MGGGSRVGGGGKSSVGGWLSRSRFFRDHHDMLKQVAVLRGLSSVEELLASLGKEESGMSIQEELDFLNKELGTSAVTQWFVAESYSGNKGRKKCEDLFKSYMKEVKEYGEPDSSTVYHLTKYCGYELKDCKEEKLEIDFVNEIVCTLVDNGTKGSDYRGGGRGTSQLLNSQWDVCFDPIREKVYIAMAGQHQIWEHNLSDEIIMAFSGDGYERNLNGSRPLSTSFAQPSGMSLSPDMKEVYIAESESSSFRALDLKTEGSRLLVSGDPIFSDNLFKFGDHDGIGAEVLLQHPLGVCFGQDGLVYIADSYNHKIKRLNPSNKRVTTLAGTGKAGFKDGKSLETREDKELEVNKNQLKIATFKQGRH